MPDVPGVIVGVDTVATMSARRALTVTKVGAAMLSAVAGSVVVVDAAANPPLSVPGAADEATATGIDTLVDEPLARLPATAQVTVPEASVQPEGSVPTVTADGGVYVKVVGPTASDGPLFVAVSTTVPDVPGVIVGEVTATATSAERAPAVTVVGETELSAGVGSVLAVAAAADPPVSTPGAAEDASDTGIDTLVDEALARLLATVQVTVPEASVQPDGSVAPEAGTVTPAGGV